jgi:catechol 2,3-dioxygenase-like lactoylglutathione lyase family enzyme
MTIDHVELFVPDREEAAAWYGQVLGLEPVREYRQWADDPRGPLMISSDGGRTKLALFTGQPRGSRQQQQAGEEPTAGFHRVAFSVTADGFVRCLKHLEALMVRDARGGIVTRASVVDHEQAYSVYFCDPYGHRLEITTYDYAAARTALAQAVQEHGDAQERP